MMRKLADVTAQQLLKESAPEFLIENWFSIIVKQASIIESHAKLGRNRNYIFFSPPVQKQLLSSPFVLLPSPLNSLFIAFAASLFRLNTFFKLTRQMDFLNGACHESISPKKLMCPMGSGHALHDALLYSVLGRKRYFETLVSPLENKWIGSIHAPFTSDWIRSPLLKVAAEPEPRISSSRAQQQRRMSCFSLLWKTVSVTRFRERREKKLPTTIFATLSEKQNLRAVQSANWIDGCELPR